MCEYCENTFKGNANELLLDNPINTDNCWMLFNNWVCIETKSFGCPKPTLDLYTVTKSGDTISHSSILINYCPICGEKLSKKTWKDKVIELEMKAKIEGKDYLTLGDLEGLLSEDFKEE